MSENPTRVVVGGANGASLLRKEFGDDIVVTEAHTDEELRTLTRDAEVLFSWQVPDIVPAETPHLHWVQLPSAGADHVRQLPVWESNVLITGSMGIHAVPMSEHLFGMVLGLTRRIADIVRAQERGEWIHDWQGAGLRVTELRGKTLGIIGWGKIGDEVAQVARAFGMRVIGTRWSVVVPREVPGEARHPPPGTPWLEALDLPPDIVYPAAQLHEVLAQSDLVAVLVPLTDETNGLIGESEFRAMRRGTLFFNLGRGAVVDETALVGALRSGRLAGAGLDVFEEEPLPRSSPLWEMGNVIVSPHVGGMSDQIRGRAIRFFAENLKRYLQGLPLLNVIDRKQGY